jgi:hypothetical protein
MKKQILFLLGLVFSLCACHQKTDSLIGEWEADKVNVQFDERRSTPEMVKQIGKSEKNNYFIIDKDSVLVFNSLEMEMIGRVTTDKQGNLFLEDAPFGQWKNGQIVTKTTSPWGEIVVTYRKKGA